MKILLMRLLHLTRIGVDMNCSKNVSYNMLLQTMILINPQTLQTSYEAAILQNIHIFMFGMKASLYIESNQHAHMINGQ
jgi:hypothetical protein